MSFKMVTAATLKAYNFETIQDYFYYILESKINGQNKQVENLINKLTKKTKERIFVFYA